MKAMINAVLYGVILAMFTVVGMGITALLLF